MAEHPVLAGTDGFRGLATTEPGPGEVNTETFKGLTYVLVADQLAAGETGPVVIARDTRLSGGALASAVVAGALACAEVEGVWNLGEAPTPMAQAVARQFGALATVVVTASHNPHQYNGWKGMLGARKPSPEEARAISDHYWEITDSGLAIPEQANTTATDRPELVSWYIHKVVADIETEFGERPLEKKLFVFDGAHGAAQHITPEVLRRLGARVEAIYCNTGGLINEGCGAENLGGLKAYLAANPSIVNNPHFVGAIANDGDGDRMMGIGVRVDSGGDRQLVTIDGNHVMAALAEGEPGIVGTMYTNSGLVTRLNEENIGFAYCDNGDSHVTQKLTDLQAAGQHWRRGGEFSGHHVDLDWLSSGDGVRMAAWFAAHTVRSSRTFGDVHGELPLWAERMVKIPFPGAARVHILEDQAVKEALQQATDTLGDGGRHVVRPSGTEPVVRLWVEARNPTMLDSVLSALVGAVALRAAA